jgi:hypothetical protein
MGCGMDFGQFCESICVVSRVLSNAYPSPLFAGQQVLDNEKFAPFAKGGVS